MKPTKRRELSWKPRWKGMLYCSSACGRGCTRAEYLKAKDEAETLAKTMGKGWKVRVHENLGWFAHVESPCGNIMVYPKRKDGKTHTVYFNAIKQFVTRSRSPKAAVRKALAQAIEYSRILDRDIHEAILCGANS